MKNKIVTIIIIIVALLFVGFLVAIGVNKYLNRGKTFVDGLVITDVEIKKDCSRIYGSIICCKCRRICRYDRN